MSAGWLGSGWGVNESSVIARHEWKGLSKMHYSVEDYVEQRAAEQTERTRLHRVRMPGSYRVESDDDDE